MRTVLIISGESKVLVKSLYNSSHLYNMLEALLWFGAAFQPMVLGQGYQN